MSQLIIREGDILKAKPKHFIPRQEGVGNVGQHPVIALTPPNATGYVLVALMSHCHPEGTPTRRASAYSLPIDPVKGESLVSIGQPHLIHQSDLKSNNPSMSMSWRDYTALKTEIQLQDMIEDRLTIRDRCYIILRTFSLFSNARNFVVIFGPTGPGHFTDIIYFIIAPTMYLYIYHIVSL